MSTANIHWKHLKLRMYKTEYPPRHPNCEATVTVRDFLTHSDEIELLGHSLEN